MWKNRHFGSISRRQQAKKKSQIVCNSIKSRFSEKPAKERKKKSISLFAFFLFKKGRLTYSQQTRHELNSLLFLLFSGETRNSKILDSKILEQDFRLQKPILEIISVFFGLTLSFLGKCNCSYVLENGS